MNHPFHQLLNNSGHHPYHEGTSLMTSDRATGVTIAARAFRRCGTIRPYAKILAKRGF